MCGIAAAYQLEDNKESTDSASLVYRLLIRLQNRGDLSSGIASYNPHGFNILGVRKGRGTPRELFGQPGSYQNKVSMESLRGVAAIGHNRYATSGDSSNDEEVEVLAHPYLRSHNRKWKEFAFAFNGNITNVDEIKKEFLNCGKDYYLKTEGDTELMRIFFSREFGELDRRPTAKDFVKLFGDFAQKFDGAYSMIFINSEGEMVLLRDPLGFHPLFYAIHQGVLVAASEDSAIRALGIDDIQEVEAGTFVFCDGKKVTVSRYAPKQRSKMCIFEFVYFMNAASTFGGRSVQRARVHLGHSLALSETLPIVKNVVTGPVPGTAIGMCDGYQHGLYDRDQTYIPRFDALVKLNESRSFIADFSFLSRDQIIRNKFDLTPDYLRGKEWVLIDDSIVRGSTSKKLFRYVRDVCKAEKIHMRSAAAPIRFPCFYGINMPTLDELIASDDKPVDKICKQIQADSLRYNSVEDMVEAVSGSADFTKDDFCLGCFTGEYPTCGGQKCLKKLLQERPAKRINQ